MPAKKKTTPKKTAVKKTVKKAPVKKKPVLNEAEQDLHNKIGKLLKEGYNVHLICPHKKIRIHDCDMMIDKLRENEGIELLCMKSGAAAKVIRL
jgi:hypothetical protein